MNCPHCGRDVYGKRQARFATIYELGDDGRGKNPITYEIGRQLHSGSRGPEAQYVAPDGLVHRVSYYDPARCYEGAVVVTGGSRYEFHNKGWE